MIWPAMFNYNSITTVGFCILFLYNRVEVQRKGGNNMELAIILGAALAFVAVACGAFGAHALKDKFTEQKYADNWETACRYMMYHAFGLLAVGIIGFVLGVSGALTAAMWCMLFGTIIFSGSLMVLSLTGIKRLGAITPIGGLFQLVAWVCVIVAVM